ncbi:MAG: hypothetical protein QXO21_00150 [Candidatus Anstonellales archaeon]
MQPINQLEKFSQVKLAGVYNLKSIDEIYAKANYYKLPIKSELDTAKKIQEKQRNTDSFYFISKPEQLKDFIRLFREKISSYHAETELEEVLHVIWLSNPQIVIQLFCEILCFKNYKDRYGENYRKVEISLHEIESKYNVGDKLYLSELIKNKPSNTTLSYDIIFRFHAFNIVYAKAAITGKKDQYFGYVLRNMLNLYFHDPDYYYYDVPQNLEFTLIDKEYFPLLKIQYENVNYDNVYNIAYNKLISQLDTNDLTFDSFSEYKIT